MLTHPTLDQLRALKLDGMAQAFVVLRRRTPLVIWRTPSGWHCCSTAKLPTAAQSASKPDCALRGCVIAKPQSRTSTTARRAGSIRRCSSN